MNISWLCYINTPPNNMNVSVQWYKARPGTAESDIMTERELLSELSSKYSFTIDRQVLAVNNHSELNFGISLCLQFTISTAALTMAITGVKS